MLFDDLEFKKKMHCCGSIKVTSSHDQHETSSHIVEYRDIPVTILVTEHHDGLGVMLYLESKRMQGERTIALEHQIIDDYKSGVFLSGEYLLGRLRESIAKTIDPNCAKADDLLWKRWYDWHPGEPHPDGSDDLDEDDFK